MAARKRGAPPPKIRAPSGPPASEAKLRTAAPSRKKGLLHSHGRGGELKRTSHSLPPDDIKLLRALGDHLNMGGAIILSLLVKDAQREKWSLSPRKQREVGVEWDRVTHNFPPGDRSLLRAEAKRHDAREGPYISALLHEAVRRRWHGFVLPAEGAGG